MAHSIKTAQVVEIVTTGSANTIEVIEKGPQNKWTSQTSTIHVSGSEYSGSGGGSILPQGSGSWDLGSPHHPFRDLYITSESIQFVDTSTGTPVIKQKLTSKNIEDLKAGKSIATGSIGGASKGLRTGGVFSSVSDKTYLKLGEEASEFYVAGKKYLQVADDKVSMLGADGGNFLVSASGYTMAGGGGSGSLNITGSINVSGSASGSGMLVYNTFTMASGSIFKFQNPGASEINSNQSSLILKTSNGSSGTVAVSSSLVVLNSSTFVGNVTAPNIILNNNSGATTNALYRINSDLYFNGNKVRLDKFSNLVGLATVEASQSLVLQTTFTSSNLIINTPAITSSTRPAVNFDSLIGPKIFTSSAAIASYATESLRGGELALLQSQGTASTAFVNTKWYALSYNNQFSNLSSTSGSFVWDVAASAFKDSDDFINAGEIIKINSEQMLVQEVVEEVSNSPLFKQKLLVERGYNGTSRASHGYGTTTYISRRTDSSPILSTTKLYMWVPFDSKWHLITTASSGHITST